MTTFMNNMTSIYSDLLIGAVFKKNEEDCKRLIALGADVNVTLSSTGDNLLIAVINNCFHKNIFKLLIDNGCDVNFTHTTKYKMTNPNPLNITPLYFAIINGNHDACKILIENGAKINIKIDTSIGDSLLHISACFREYKICILLVDYGADVLEENNRGERASFCCKNSGHNLNLNSITAKIYRFLKTKEQEREELNRCFKRTHIDDSVDNYDDIIEEEEPEIIDYEDN